MISVSSLGDRLRELLALEPGWYNGEGDSYSEESLVFAQSLVDRLEPKPRIYPNPEKTNCLSFEWSFPNHEAGLDLDLDSRVGSLIVADLRTRDFRSFDLSLTNPEDIDRVNDILRSSS